MKKIILWMLLFAGCGNLFAQAEESRLIINPGRETFVHFPSTVLGNAYTVTFFLPERAVPLHSSYPVLVMLGLTPKHAELVKNFQQQNKVLVVGVNFTEQDYAEKSAKIVQFLSQELLPYVDTNYLTKTGPENRILAATGKSAARVALQVVQNPQLYGGLFLSNPADVWREAPLPAVRTLVVGEQSELAQAQITLEQAGKVYGPDFALRYKTQQEDLWRLSTSYFSASGGDLAITKLSPALSARILFLGEKQTARLRVWAILADGSLFDYIPAQLRFSPPYLHWEPFSGRISVVAGAVQGKVQVRNGVDKMPFSVKIKLKKQPKKDFLGAKS